MYSLLIVLPDGKIVQIAGAESSGALSMFRHTGVQVLEPVLCECVCVLLDTCAWALGTVLWTASWGDWEPLAWGMGGYVPQLCLQTCFPCPRVPRVSRRLAWGRQHCMKMLACSAFFPFFHNSKK